MAQVRDDKEKDNKPKMKRRNIRTITQNDINRATQLMVNIRVKYCTDCNHISIENHGWCPACGSSSILVTNQTVGFDLIE